MAKLSQALVLSLLLAVSTSVHAQSLTSSLTNGLSSLTTPLQRETERHIDTQKRVIGTVLNIDPDTQFSTFFPTISGFNQSQILECYNSSIGDIQFDIFKNTIFDAIKIYYKNFPENFELTKFPDKVKNLLKSLKEVGTHTIQCLVNPAEYQLGITQFTDFSDPEYKAILGARHGEEEGRRLVSNFAERQRTSERTSREESNEESKVPSESSESNANQTVSSTTTEAPSSQTTSTTAPTPSTTRASLLKIGSSSSNSSSLLGKATGGLLRLRRQQVTVDPICFPKNKSPLPERFDWRSRGKVTPARYQGSCGSCWAFASLGALESAYLIKGKTNNNKFDLSEQQLLGCARKNGCKGGTSVDAFNYILSNDGVTDEGSLPYDKKENNCDTRKKPKMVAKVDDYCLRGIYAKVNGKPEQLTDEQIMQVVREFGPVYATINADHVAVKHLKSGTYNNPKCPKTTNHAILIVGWDKKAWIIKNSWGKKWADDGFFRMKRGQNLCGLNTYITFPIL